MRQIDRAFIALWAALVLPMPLAHATDLQPLNDTGITFSGAATLQPLNDTGITFSGAGGDGNATTCDLTTHPKGQDCQYGRDAAAATNNLTKIGGGNAGFDFTKISNSGAALPDSATLGSGNDDWACTRDNVTGLIWEVKTDDSGLRDKDHTYTWYNTESSTNGGANGGEGNTSTCGSTLSGNKCNTQNYVAAVNAAGLCGFNDWRMPTKSELEGIVDFGRSSPPTIDTDFFPNTPGAWFWSGSPVAYLSNFAWDVNFSNGGSFNVYRYGYGLHVRLVRAGQ